MTKIVEKANEMLHRTCPARQCRWCGHELKAGQVFCPACKGNRLVPARWWPVTAASAVVLVLATCAMSYVLVSIWTAEGAVVPAAGAPQAEPQAAPTEVMMPAQSIFSLPAVSASPLSGQSPISPDPFESPLDPVDRDPPEGDPPEPTRAATPESTSTPTPEPTQTPTLEPTDTPALELTHTPTLEPTSTPLPAPTSTYTPAPTPTTGPDPRFRADRTVIPAGECALLAWDIEGVKAVFLDGAGRPGHSTEWVCPIRSHTYKLKVVMPDGREYTYPLHIEVQGTLPLTLNVMVTDRTCDTEESYAAEISIWAQGGDGWYTYYHDSLDHYIGGPMETGMVYLITWRTCGGAPGTFIVRSGDGQEARQQYWVEPPDCCGEYH